MLGIGFPSVAFTYQVGQTVGLMDEVKSRRAMVEEFLTEYVEAIEEMQVTL